MYRHACVCTFDIVNFRSYKGMFNAITNCVIISLIVNADIQLCYNLIEETN